MIHMCNTPLLGAIGFGGGFQVHMCEHVSDPACSLLLAPFYYVFCIFIMIHMCTTPLLRAIGFGGGFQVHMCEQIGVCHPACSLFLYICFSQESCLIYCVYIGS